MTPEDLWNILDTERRTSTVQRLPDDFILDLQGFIADLSFEPAENARNARLKTVSIVQRRQGKIIKLAVGNAEMPGTLLKIEQFFFEEIRGASRAFEIAMLKELNGEE